MYVGSFIQKKVYMRTHTQIYICKLHYVQKACSNMIHETMLKRIKYLQFEVYTFEMYSKNATYKSSFNNIWGLHQFSRWSMIIDMEYNNTLLLSGNSSRSSWQKYRDRKWNALVRNIFPKWIHWHSKTTLHCRHKPNFQTKPSKEKNTILHVYCGR